MPNLEHFALSIDLNGFDVLRHFLHNQDLLFVPPSVLLPDPVIHPHITALTIEVRLSDDGADRPGVLLTTLNGPPSTGVLIFPR